MAVWAGSMTEVVTLLTNLNATMDWPSYEKHYDEVKMAQAKARKQEQSCCSIS